MYDRHLDAFITVADHGSFAKAGEALCLSPNAVIKQVNCLERDLGVPLFHRNARGVSLTASGEVVYRGAVQIIAESHEIVRSALMLSGVEVKKVRLASSAMRSVERIGLWWSEIGREHPLIMLEIVPVVDSVRLVPALYERIGRSIDVLLAIEPLPERLLRWRCEARPLFTSPACIAVPVGHRLVGRSGISLCDLDGERLYLTARGYTAQIERLRDEIARMNLRVDIVDCPPYDAEVFNSAAEERALVLHCLELGRTHPAYTNVPLHESYEFPLCLVYAKDADDPVREFVEAMVERAAHGA